LLTENLPKRVADSFLKGNKMIKRRKLEYLVEGKVKDGQIQ
jgi:hypothetical protein